MQRCILLVLALIPVLTGCAHYGYSHHTRLTPIYAGTPLYALIVGTNASTAPNPIYLKEVKDRTGSTMFFVMGKAAQIKSKTTDENYTKDLDIGGLEGQVDGAAIEASLKGLGAATGEAMRAYMGLPPLPVPAAAASTGNSTASSLVESYKANLQQYLPPATNAPAK